MACADTLGSGAKAAVGSVQKVPQSLVNMGSGLFAPQEGGLGGVGELHESWFGGVSSSPPKPSSAGTVAQMKKELSLARLETLKLKTQQHRNKADKEKVK